MRARLVHTPVTELHASLSVYCSVCPRSANMKLVSGLICPARTATETFGMHTHTDTDPAPALAVVVLVVMDFDGAHLQ